jgi:hypothetical protein
MTIRERRKADRRTERTYVRAIKRTQSGCIR